MHPRNQQIALRLQEAAEILAGQQANPFRINAYRRAAQTVAQLERDIAEIVDESGLDGLTALPEIGKGIAAAIHELVRTGRWSQLERMRETLDPVRLFQTVPGIGPELAARLHEQLHVETLEALENAAFDGRVAALPGIGPRRLQNIQAMLAAMMGRRRTQAPARELARPDIALLLAIDRDYRAQAAAGTLRLIAPRRFNPDGHAWLPILHAGREGWHFTALFSNTELAHRLQRTDDWVVIYFYDDEHREGQNTVVTESHGALAGQRVVRGREAECRAYYASAADGQQANTR